MRSPKTLKQAPRDLQIPLATREEYWETGVTRWSEEGGGGKFPES